MGVWWGGEPVPASRRHGPPLCAGSDAHHAGRRHGRAVGPGETCSADPADDDDQHDRSDHRNLGDDESDHRDHRAAVAWGAHAA